MNTLTAALTAPAVDLTAEREADLVGLAHYGDEDAAMTLVSAYSPAIRGAVSRFPSLDREDAEAEAVTAFLGLVALHDPATGRLAGRVKVYLTDALQTAAGAASHGWSIPARTVKRFLGILAAADGDLEAGERLAPSYEMKRETFAHVAAVLRRTESLTSATPEGERETASYALEEGGGDPFTDVDDALLVDYLFTKVSDDERGVLRAAYGFDAVEVDEQVIAPEGAAPVSDALVGASLGLSRPKTQRLRSAGLAKMRNALALGEA